MLSPWMNPLRESGKSSYCNRGSCQMTVLTLQLLAVHQMVLNPRAPLKHRRLGPPLLHSKAGKWHNWNQCLPETIMHLGIPWTSLTRTLLINAIFHQVHVNGQQILLVHGSTGNHAVPYSGECGIKKACVFKRQVFKTHLTAKTWNDHIAKWASLWIYNFSFKPRLTFQAYKQSRIKMSLSPSNSIFSLICPLDRTGFSLPVASLWPECKASSCLVSSKTLRLLLLSSQGLPISQGWKSFCMWIFLFCCPKHFCKTRRMLHPIAYRCQDTWPTTQQVALCNLVRNFEEAHPVKILTSFEFC